MMINLFHPGQSYEFPGGAGGSYMFVESVPRGVHVTCYFINRDGSSASFPSTTAERMVRHENFSPEHTIGDADKPVRAYMCKAVLTDGRRLTITHDFTAKGWISGAQFFSNCMGALGREYGFEAIDPTGLTYLRVHHAN